MALRRDPQTTTKNVQDLAAEVVRLQLAGVGSTTPQTERVAQATVTDPDASHSSPSLVDQIAERVYQLKTNHDDGTSETETSHVQVVRHKTAPSRGRYSGYSNSGPQMRSRIFYECSICGEDNHTRKFCPRRNHCYRCLKPGHYARDCRANQPSRPSFGKGRVMVLAVERHGLLRVDVQLGGLGYHPFLVDTGAEISLIPASLASNIKGKINRQLSRQPVMVDGSSIRSEGTVTCRIRLGPRDISAQFYIVLGITEGILGLDTLSHLDLQIDTRTRRLLIDGHAIPECEWLRPPERSRLQIQLVRFGKVYATTDEYIAPGQEYTVWGKVHCPDLRPDETYTGVVEVTERLPASHGLVECCTLAIGGPSQHVPVKVFNLSEETVRIHICQRNHRTARR